MTLCSAVACMWTVSHLKHSHFFVCKLITAATAPAESSCLGAWGALAGRGGTQVGLLLRSLCRAPCACLECPCASAYDASGREKKGWTHEKLSQIGKCTVWGCLALQHMLCDCAFKTACQEELVCSGHICQPAGVSICLTPRLGTWKQRLLPCKCRQG